MSNFKFSAMLASLELKTPGTQPRFQLDSYSTVLTVQFSTITIATSNGSLLLEKRGGAGLMNVDRHTAPVSVRWKRAE
jgi:hypothetical protein